MQHALSFDLWLIGTLVTNLATGLDREDLHRIGIFKWADIPHELEARIVAKRVTETLFPKEDVRSLIRQRINEAVTPDDRVDWQFIDNLSIDEPYDLATETRKLLSRLRPYKRRFQAWLSQYKNILGTAGFDLDEWLD